MGVPPLVSKVIVMLFAGTGFHLAYTAVFFITGVLAVKAVPVLSGLVYQPTKV